MPQTLNRFLDAQADVYETALAELITGHKRTHWMWFVFPQIQGLGSSETARHFAIGDKAEALDYLEHPVLGRRLRECAETVLKTDKLSAADIFGYPDELKLKSSMTLFEHVADEENSIFTQVLKIFYSGQCCELTLQNLDAR